MNLSNVIDRIAKREIGFRQLPVKLRTAVVGFLKCGGMLTEEAAAALDVPASTIYYHWGLYERILAGSVRRNAGQYIGRLVAKGEHLYKSAKAAGNLDLCWRIECDILDRLIRLGLVDAKPDRIDLRVLNRVPTEIIEAELAGDLTLLKRIEEKCGVQLGGQHGGGNGQGGGGNGAPGDNGHADADGRAAVEPVPDALAAGGGDGARRSEVAGD